MDKFLVIYDFTPLEPSIVLPMGTPADESLIMLASAMPNYAIFSYKSDAFRGGEDWSDLVSLYLKLLRGNALTLEGGGGNA